MSRTPDESVVDKKKYLAARVAGSLLDALKDIAHDERRSVSFMTEEAIREYVENRKKSKRDKRTSQ